MAADGISLLSEIQQLYDKVRGDVDFAAVLQASDSRDDAVLAELIEADGRLRIARGRSVTLTRYLTAIPDLRDRPDSLDAAIDVTLRAMSGGSCVSDEATQQLVEQFPDLEEAIREAAALNAAIWSTEGLHERVTRGPVRPLPYEFGPRLATGERRYQLQKLLGQGAFGQVYLALDRHLSEDDHTAMVAIKILATADRSPWARQRLIEEATKARRINHPNVVLVHDRGVTEQNEDYIVYEYVDGGDLSDALERQPIPIDEAVRLVRKIAMGVHAAHAAGVIHCDLKPGNIMLTSAGEPKVADFGIAVRLGESQDFGYDLPNRRSNRGPIGNVAFISPEQYRGDDNALAVPSDVYALGGILFLLLTGTLPNGSSLEEIARNHDVETGRREPPMLRPLNPKIDRDLEAICRRAMAVKPEDRHSSAAALAEDLERWSRREPLTWTNPSVVRIASLWARRKPGLAAAMATIVVLVLAGAATLQYWMSVAAEHRMQAAIAQLEVQHKEERERAIQLLVTRVTRTLGELGHDYRLATEGIIKVWLLEYVFGSKLLDIADAGPELWKSRISLLRNAVRTFHEQGRAEHMETAMWESALAFWLVSDKDYKEAEPLLRANIAKWERAFPQDPWIEHLRAMAAAAVVNRFLVQTEAGAHARHWQEAEWKELQEAEARLLAVCEGLPEDHRGTPFHLLALRSLKDLYSPQLLDQPQRAAAIDAEYAELTAPRSKRAAARAAARMQQADEQPAGQDN